MRNIVRLGGLFIGTGLLALILVAPRTASSQTRGIGGPGCTLIISETDDYACPLITDSTTYTVTALSGMWFDFACYSGHTVVYKFKKFSSSGAYSFDEGFVFCDGNGAESRWRAAENVLYNADPSDHLFAEVWNAATVFGVTACFSGGANDCT